MKVVWIRGELREGVLERGGSFRSALNALLIQDAKESLVARHPLHGVYEVGQGVGCFPQLLKLAVDGAHRSGACPRTCRGKQSRLGSAS